jgi:hypothetical protein
MTHLGYYGEGAETIDYLLDTVRREVENTDCLQGDATGVLSFFILREFFDRLSNHAESWRWFWLWTRFTSFESPTWRISWSYVSFLFDGHHISSVWMKEWWWLTAFSLRLTCPNRLWSPTMPCSVHIIISNRQTCSSLSITKHSTTYAHDRWRSPFRHWMTVRVALITMPAFVSMSF